MRNRVDKLGVSEPEIRTQGDDQIVIQLPGVQDPEAAAEIIGTTAQLELFDLEASLTGPSTTIRGEPVETTSLYGLLAQVQAQVRTGSPRRTTSSTRRRSASSRARTAPSRKRFAQSAASCPPVERSSRCPRHGRRHAARARSCARVREARRRARPHLLLPLRVHPPKVPQMTARTSSCQARAPTSTRVRRRRPADRDDGVHGRGRTSSRRSHAASGSGASSATCRSTSRSSSTARSRRSPRSTSPTRA